MSDLPRPVFHDAHTPPRQWVLRITLAHVRDIQAMYPDFRLERILLHESPEAQRIADDTVLLCDVLQVLLLDQLRAQSVSFSELMESFQGATVDAAYIALVSAVANFCHSRVAKEQARRILTAYEALLKLDQQTAEQLSQTPIYGSASGLLPPVPASAPGTTPCGNSATSPALPPGGEPPSTASTSPHLAEPYPLPLATSTP